MITILCMRMIVIAAIPVIDQVRRYDQHHCRHQQQNMILKKHLFQHQKKNARRKQQDWPLIMVMVFVTMV